MFIAATVPYKAGHINGFALSLAELKINLIVTVNFSFWTSVYEPAYKKVQHLSSIAYLRSNSSPVRMKIVSCQVSFNFPFPKNDKMRLFQNPPKTSIKYSKISFFSV